MPTCRCSPRSDHGIAITLRLRPDSGSVQCAVEKCPQLRSYRMGAGRDELRHEDSRHVLDRIDKECRAGRTSPAVLTWRTGNAVFDRIDDNGHAETEPYSVQRHLCEKRSPERLQVGVVWEVIA